MILDDISKNTDISLTSIYTSTKDTDKEINGSISLNISWTSTIEGKIESNINNYSEIAGKSILITNYKSVMNNVNLPMESTNFELNVPEIEGQIPDEVKVIENGKEISNEEYTYDKENKRVNIIKSNVANEENKVRQMSGNMEYVVIYTYNKELKLKKVNTILNSNLKLKAYTLEEVVINNSQEVEKEKNNVTTNLNINTEAKISKGYLYNKENYEMPYSVNLEAQIQYIIPNSDIEIVENGETLLGDNVNINVSSIAEYKNTTINKDELVNILGENGVLEIINADTNKVLTRINKDTEADENGNIVINYAENKEANIRIVTSKPVSEGTLEINNEKTIKASNYDIVKNANTLETKITAEYNNKENENYTKGASKENTSKTELKNSQTEASFEINKDTLSTIVNNEVEMKIVLKSNNEKYNLYQNPTLVISMPEQVQNITINSVDMLYENDLKISDYRVDGKNIILTLEGKQQGYKDQTIDGANIIINASLEVNPKSATSNENISLAYSNLEETKTVVSNIQIVAPKDITAVHSIKDLSVETLGQEEKTSVTLEKGKEARNVTADIEVINNNQEEIRNVRILGTFPTNSDKNNMGITLNSGITLKEGIQGKVYYSSNENADSNLQNSENGWTEELNLNEAKKYLIIIDNMPGQTNITASYIVTIPEN